MCMRLNSGSESVTLSSGSWNRRLSEREKEEIENEKKKKKFPFKSNQIEQILVNSLSPLFLLPRTPFLWPPGPPRLPSPPGPQHEGSPLGLLSQL